MLRIAVICILSLPKLIYYIIKTRIIRKHMDEYSDETRYGMEKDIANHIVHRGFIDVECTGTENLPKDGGYVLYPNHQGKFDPIAVGYTHPGFLSYVMDSQRSEMAFANEMMWLSKGKRLDKSDMRKQVATIMEIISEVRDGARYVLFPEGGYDHNHNELQNFLPGAFKCSQKSRTPIVPVALIDTYRPFETNSLRRVRTQVHYLKPIYYEEYKDLSTTEIAEKVKKIIACKIKEMQAE